MLYLRRALFLLLLLNIVGCESGGTDYVFTPGSVDSSGPSERNRVVVGQVDLYRNIPGATMRLERPDGSVIATGTADNNGYVFFRDVVIGSDFRAVATLPNSSVELRAEIRGYRQNNKHARVSLLTTLASHYREAHPDLSIDQAESAVKELLRIPPAVDLSIAPRGINPFFSDIAFLRAMGEAGGFESFLQQLSAAESAVSSQSTNTTPRAFLLSVDQLDRPLTGLDPGLLALGEDIRLEQATRLKVPQATPDQLAIRYTPGISLVAGPTSLGGQFLLGIGTGVSGNIVSAGVNSFFGWAANQMGLNYGTQGTLDEIEGELNALTVLVANFAYQSTVSDLTTDFNSLTDLFNSNSSGGADVQDDNQSMLTALRSSSGDITDVPVVFTSPTTGVPGLVADLQSSNYKGALNEAQTQLYGTPSNSSSEFLAAYAQSYFNYAIGLDTPSQNQYLPWRSNHILNTPVVLYQQFAELQTQTLNLLVENSHAYPLSPVNGVQASISSIRSAYANLKLQRQLLPLYSSQWGIIVDLESGTMWDENMRNPSTYQDAVDALTGDPYQMVFPDGSTITYSDWRLPNYGECLQLQARGTYSPTYSAGVPVNSTNSYPDTGQSTAGLPTLGFNNVSTALNASQNDNGSNGDMWMSYAIDTEEGIGLEDNWEFRLNHASENTNDENSSKDTNVWLRCRTFGPKLLVTPAVNYQVGSDGSINQSILNGNYVGDALTAGEIAQWGVPSSMTLSVADAPTSISVPPTSSSGSSADIVVPIPEGSVKLVASITYSLTVGNSSYSMGTGTSTKSFKTSPTTYTGTVTTATTNGNPNYLQDLVSWTSGDYSLSDVYNYPFVSGIVVPFSTSPVTLTGTLSGAAGAAVVGTLSYTPTAAATKTLTGIQITPRNVTYGGSSIAPASGPAASYPYYCTAFYSDGTMADVSGQATWTVPSNPANAQVTVASNAATFQLNQPAETTSTPYTLEISASYQGFSDSMTIQIIPPVN